MSSAITPHLYQLYLAIANHLRYRTNYSGVHSNNSDNTHHEFRYSNSKRIYTGAVSRMDSVIHLHIREDGDTRTVFSGVIYTIEQFLLIDQLTMII